VNNVASSGNEDVSDEDACDEGTSDEGASGEDALCLWSYRHSKVIGD
jgi:hypothetical protein